MSHQSHKFNFYVTLRATVSALAFLLVLNVAATPAAQAQTLTVLHNFTGGTDGTFPSGGLTADKAGNLYGTATYGGGSGCYGGGCGTAFKLSKKGSGWVFTPLYAFQGGTDGAHPEARVIFGPDGSLYGTTFSGGAGYGTVFNLKPSATACKTALCPWIETVLYRFTGASDGEDPVGDLIFDQFGNLYGAARAGGMGGCCGVVYELVPSNGGWTESVLHSFTGGNDGGTLNGGVIFDQSGNLYGVAAAGGAADQGTVYELTPSGSGWTENTLYDFQGEYGDFPVGSLLFDGSGNLYGVTQNDIIGEPYDPGTVYGITKSNGAWTLKASYDFAWDYPTAGLTMDAAGNLYGTTMGILEFGGYGSVFSFTSDLNKGNYILDIRQVYNYLNKGPVNYSFTGGDDGGNPISIVIFDANGNLYGTATGGGVYGYGVIWEIMP